MSDGVSERLGELEEAVRRALDVLGRLRAENAQLKREVRRLADEHKHALAQVDAILKDLAKLELDRTAE